MSYWVYRADILAEAQQLLFPGVATRPGEAPRKIVQRAARKKKSRPSRPPKELEAKLEAWEESTQNKRITKSTYGAFVRAKLAPRIPKLKEVFSGKAWKKTADGTAMVLHIGDMKYTVRVKRDKKTGRMEGGLYRVLDVTGGRAWLGRGAGRGGDGELIDFERVRDKGDLKRAVTDLRHRAYSDLTTMGYDEDGTDFMIAWLDKEAPKLFQ